MLRTSNVVAAVSRELIPPRDYSSNALGSTTLGVNAAGCD
jgi:hypothetical protein